MKRLLLNVLTATSALLCVAMTAICVRSYWAVDDFKWANTEFGADQGRIFFKLLGKNWKPGLHHRVYDPAEAGSADADYRQWTPDFEFADTKFDAWFFAIALRKQHAGFWTFSYRTVVVRVWPIAAVAAILPLVRIRSRIRQRRRGAQGRCPRCGYDLRASPSKCPECGLPAKAEHGDTAAT